MERVRDKAHARNYPNTERTCVHHEDKKEIRSEATFHFRLFTNSCKAIRCKSSDGDIKQAIEEKKRKYHMVFPRYTLYPVLVQRI